MPAPVLPGAPDTGGPLDSNVQVQALPVNIDTADDLKLYIQSLEQEDADLIDIKVEKDSIVFSYREQARFLGSLSMSVLATVKVNDAGVVSLRYPWYTSSSAIDDDKLKDELQTDVSRVIGNGNLSDLSIRSRAEMLLALDTVLKAHTMSEVK